MRLRGRLVRAVTERRQAVNNLRVFVLMAGLTALFIAVGSFAGGDQGMIIALVLAAAINLGLYYSSSSLVLRMYGARPVTQAEAPELYEIVDELRSRAGLPMPVVAIAAQEQPNAFATGRNAEHAVVCVTEGILGVLDRDELSAVLGHELAHVVNRDMLLMTVAATIAAAVSNLARFGLWFGGGRRRDRRGSMEGLAMLILAPIAAMLIQLAISRQREYKADAGGAQISGDATALARALRKLEDAAHQIPMNVSPAVAPLAQVNPLAAYGTGLAALFSTHPPITERIARLQRMDVRGVAESPGSPRIAIV